MIHVRFVGLYPKLLACGMLLILCSCGRYTETYRDQNVSAGQIKGPIDFLAVHTGQPSYLKVRGHTFKNVRGLEPFYLPVAEINAVLFVTEEWPHGVTFHIVNLQTGKHTQIEGQGSVFGMYIGSKRTAREKGTDYVENAEPSKLVVTTRSWEWKETTTLDLNKNKIERSEHLQDEQK